jgi:hypothetical protein
MRRVVTVFFGMLCLFLFLHAVDADAEMAKPSAISQKSAASSNIPAGQWMEVG